MRKRMAKFAIVAACLLGPAPAFAADGLDIVRQRVAQVAVLRGGFEQEKQVAGFRNPLRSQGRFVLARGKGVVWTTLQPFPSELVVTRDRILSRQRDGSLRVEVDARQQPAMRSVNAVMFSLMSGDVGALASRFDLQAQALPGDAWKLTLKPKSAALARSFASIELQGDRYVREVGVVEGNGDRTRLRFVELSETPAQLDADEARKLD
ncbi:outer membrane lipoprotein carrier protein LolA [Pseudoxanthomonas sangjuensis]|nr:outer membrane lipoprotein carrier protein LolA [Pseudoxanthomonas sangjuensis]